MTEEEKINATIRKARNKLRKEYKDIKEIIFNAFKKVDECLEDMETK